MLEDAVHACSCATIQRCNLECANLIPLHYLRLFYAKVCKGHINYCNKTLVQYIICESNCYYNVQIINECALTVF